MKHVYIFGWCHHGDLAHLQLGENDTELSVFSGPTINAYEPCTDAWYDALGAAANTDLAIFAGYGVDMAQHIAPIFRDTTGAKIFDSIPRKVYWSFDTPRQWRAEAAYAHHFDAFYVAHEPYLPLLPQARHLPAAFYLASWQEVVDILKARNEQPPAERQYDLVYPAYTKEGTDQHVLKDLAQVAILSRGVKHSFNPVADRLDYCRQVAAAKVCLNIPLTGALNFRHFEAWMFNTVLLTAKTNAIPNPLKRRTVMYSRDMTDFDEMLDKALNAQFAPTCPAVIQSHMVMHRYLQIVNESFSTNYSIAYPDIA